MGYHNEHHDFAGIPWNNLPKLRRMAPEYYDSLKSYRSWTAVLLKFIFDPSMSTYSRVVRAAQKRDAKRSALRAARTSRPASRQALELDPPGPAPQLSRVRQ
jgi:sphingolipid delta-4 desaturase